MNQSILNNKYKLLWKEANEKVFVAELKHFIKNEFGGGTETPIGILVGFIEDRPKFWNVKLIVRSDIKYSQTQNKIFVLTKSAYKNKIKYYLDKLVDMVIPNLRVDDELLKELKKYLIDNKFCHEPMSLSISEETNKAFEFDGEVSLEDYD